LFYGANVNVNVNVNHHAIIEISTSDRTPSLNVSK